MNVASNTIITDDSALGFINAAEDIDLTPLKSFFMKRSEFITVDSRGQFKMSSLKYPATEVVGIFYQFNDLYQQNEYLQYVDPVTFGKGYGTVYTDALYTITTSSDGTNEQVVQVYPAPPSAKIGIEYYCDWSKLGDLTTNSKLQQVSLEITGTAGNTGTIKFKSTIGTTTTPEITVNIASGDTSTQIRDKILASNIPFQSLPGNNLSYWSGRIDNTTGQALLTSPRYISETSQLQVTVDVENVLVNVNPQQEPFIQTVQTNWLMFNYPYLYYYAALKHAYNGLEDAERYGFVEKEFMKAVQVFQQFTDRAEWGGVSRQSDYNQNVIW